MTRILLSCALGMSTGMLMERMRDAAKEQGKEIKVWAVDTGSIAANEGEFDVLLLGPQVTYLLGDMQKKYGDQVPVSTIKPIDYGRMNGAAVLAYAEELIANFGK